MNPMGTTVTELPSHGVLELAGSDAERFLQNQLTVDVRDLPADRSLLGAVCTPQGRVVASFRIFRAPTSFLLVLPRSVLPVLRDHLSKYRLRARVDIEAWGEGSTILGVFGEGAARTLGDAGLPTPPSPPGPSETGTGEVSWFQDTLVGSVPGEGPRFIVVSRTGALEALARSVPLADALSAETAWRLADIRAGLPTVWPETVEAFLPQMMNLDAVGGVSFTKGCYPGQEVVARLRYLGQLKRRMIRGSVAGDPPPPGSPVFGDVEGEPAVVGKVVDAAPAHPGSSELLAVVQLTHAREDAVLAVLAPDGPALRVLPLPYRVDDATA